MITIQATDCNGTALAIDAPKSLSTRGTATGLMLTLKTGLVGGQRNRILTFIVEGPNGEVDTYTRVPGGVRHDATGQLITEAPAPTAECGCCGDVAGQGSGRAKAEDGTQLLLCRDCLTLETSV